MSLLVILLAVGLMLAYIHKRDVEDILPPFLMTLMLFNYALAIIGKGHHSFELSVVIFIIIAAVCVFCFIRRRKCPSVKSPAFNLKQHLSDHIGLYIYLIMCLLMIYGYSTHFVNVWDDFHYNATFPKDCFYFGTMPYGTNLATYYKSYLPLQQLLFYWGFQGFGFFEPMMFQYKMVLIYTLMLPLFSLAKKSKGVTRIVNLIFPAILPFLFLFEVIESLSMDTVMAAMFAYALINIAVKKEEKPELFRLYCILVSTVSLILMKSIAAMFAGITLGVWLFVLIVKSRRESLKEFKSEWIEFLVTGFSTLLAYLSWKIYCNRHGNTTYLSNILSDNLSEGGKFSLPSYGQATIQNILKSIFTMKMNLGPTGMSLFAVILISVALLAILIINKSFDRTDLWTSVILAAGLLVYVAFLCYTYCFIFEQWEAESLSSLDRYFGTYALTVLYVIVYRINLDVNSSKIVEIALWATCIISLVTLPYQNIFNTVMPKKYLEKRADMYAVREEVSEELHDFAEAKLPMGYVVIVNNSENDMYSRSMDYEVIPLVSRPFNSAGYESEGEIRDAFLEKIADVNPDYIYFTEHERLEHANLYDIPTAYRAHESIEGLYVK